MHFTIFEKKLSLLELRDYENAQGKYLMSQIISYNEEAAISHIEKHMESDNNDNYFKFVEGFPLRDVYSKLRGDILSKNKNKRYTEIIITEHFFKYEANGHVGSKLVDYFVVATLKDSNDIISMYPYENNERIECIDLTSVVEELPKQKRISQIDKFNQRYGKMVDKK